MEKWIEKNRKQIFFIVIGICFIGIFFFNMLTPIMSDDIHYMIKAKQAHSLLDIFLQEVEHHQYHSGRNVAHFLLRIFLRQDKIFFNIANSVVFIILTLELYWSTTIRKKYDFGLFIIIQILLWTQAVSFGETILWEDGSFNYMWGTVFIMTFVLLYRKAIEHSDMINRMPKYKQLLLTIGLFLLGIIAGWCNENTSGGGFLLAAIFLFVAIKTKKITEKKPWMITSLIGVLIGMGLMMSSPGNWARDTFDEETETYSGIVGLASHLLKIIVTTRRLFTLLIILLVVLMVFLYLRNKKENLIYPAIWGGVALITALVLVFITEPDDRAYFGVGIFFIMACVEAIAQASEENNYLVIPLIRTSVVILGCLWLGTTWIIQGANLARIHREVSEREVFAQRELEAGEEELILPAIRTDFKNKYSFIHKVDLTENPGYWVNIYYEDYYEVDSVIGIDRDLWDEQYGSLYGND